MHTLLIPKDFWHGERKIGEYWQPDKIAGYYNSLVHKTLPYAGSKSPLGVPLVKFAGTELLHPVTVCQVALGWYDRWLAEQKEDDHIRFIELADWLVESQIDRTGIGGVWLVPYGSGLYCLAPDWISALVQGQALSVLTRAWQDSGQRHYLHAAREAVQPFGVDVKDGGIRAWLNHDLMVFEEYPTTKPSVVLNGFISSLWGLRDFSLAAGDAEVQALYNRGVSSLLQILPLYDTGFWSRYSLYQSPWFSNLASPYYHQEHIVQLQVMYTLTQEPLFLNTAEQWTDYARSPIHVGKVLLAKFGTRIANRIHRTLPRKSA